MGHHACPPASRIIIIHIIVYVKYLLQEQINWVPKLITPTALPLPHPPPLDESMATNPALCHQTNIYSYTHSWRVHLQILERLLLVSGGPRTPPLPLMQAGQALAAQGFTVVVSRLSLLYQASPSLPAYLTPYPHACLPDPPAHIPRAVRAHAD